jgi:hypothetical protein
MASKDTSEAPGTDALLHKLAGMAKRQLSAQERQEALVSKLVERAVSAPLVEGGTQGRRVATFAAQHGCTERAHDFLQQLNRIGEAQHVLDLAWSGGYFDDCMCMTTTVFTRKGDRKDVLDMDRIEETCANVKARAYELLAEQYPDVRVRVDQPHRWETGKGGAARCWCRVLGGPENV